MGPPRTRLMSGRITVEQFNRARNLCAHKKAIPDDWSDWFPSAIPLLVKLDGPHIRIRDLVQYMQERLKNIEDPYRFIEVAQCAALIHYLGSPPDNTIVSSIYGK